MESQKIRGAATKVLARRPELAARLRDAGITPEQIDALARGRLGAGLAGGLEAAVERDVAVPNVPLSTHAALESIIEEIGRPTLFVNGSDFDLPAEEDFSQRLRAARALIAPALRSVGRVEVFDGSVKWSVATAWMIAENVAITNRHVAEKFAMLDSRGRPVLQTDLRGRSYKVVIDFREEHGSADESEIEVESVIYLPPKDGQTADIALLRVKPGPNVPRPIPLLGERLQVGRWVAVVGYPQPDDRIPPQAREIEENYFSNIYGVKRLSPGQIDPVQLPGAPAWLMAHDATTLGGNSASVVLDLATGNAAGIHFKGVFKKANYAIDATEIRRILAEQHIASVNINPASRPATEVTLQLGDEEAAEDLNRFKGYVADFISPNGPDEFEIPLPEITDTRHGPIAERNDGEGNVLTYRNFSVVMNEKRRMCYFSAVNINGKKLFSISGARPGWKFDRRLATELQIKEECYGEETEGKFSRGHMTRREDPNWGRERDDAVISNRHTFYVTNACPQMQTFNGGIWLRLEEYALENCEQDEMRICVFTGPVFKDRDPGYFDVKVPVEFWKIIAFKHDRTKKLSATAYMMSQRDVLPTEDELVFGQFRNSQVTIRHVESLTGLSFHHLRDHDPFDDDTESLAVRTLRTPADLVFA